GAPEAPRPLGPRAGTGRARPVLVVPAGVVGAARAARGGRGVLRRLGGLGPARLAAGVRDGPCRNAGVPVRGPARAPAGGAPHRTSPSVAKEADDDHAWHGAPESDRGGLPGPVRAGGGPAPAGADVGPEPAARRAAAGRLRRAARPTRESPRRHQAPGP